MTTTTPTGSTNSTASSSASSAILSALGSGSGIDVNNLVDQLSAAQKAPQQGLIDKRQAANTAKVSALGNMSGAIDSFASALNSLISGGSLFSQPDVSDSSVLTATALAGSRIGNLSAAITVSQIAAAQTLASTALTNRAQPVGEGTLTITTASGSFDVVIDSSNNSLDGLAQAINKAGAGVTASVVTDTSGARLVIKGQTGAANSFTMAVPDGTASGLERFAYDPDTTGGMDRKVAAQDAILSMDGVEVHRASNSFSDLIPGVQITLKKAAPDSPVSMGATRPTAAIQQAVGDFVEAFNQLQQMINEAIKPGTDGTAGPLRGDIGVQQMQRQLAQLTTAVLSSAGDGPHTLAEIGVRTNRDGTLSVDQTVLAKALADNPDGVEALFNPSQSSSSPFLTIKSSVTGVKPGTYTVTDIQPGPPASGKIDGVAFKASGSNLIAPSGSKAVGLILGVSGAVSSATITIDPGLGGALQAIRDSLRASGGAFATTSQRLKAEADRIADDQTKLDARSEQYYNQLLASFTKMDQQVSSFKATQAYLDQQVKMWTSGNN
jgi:flagellar hook-associated protein 2